jgi:hypothetical protein
MVAMRRKKEGRDDTYHKSIMRTFDAIFLCCESIKIDTERRKI